MAAGVQRPSACQTDVSSPQSLALTSLALSLGSGQAQDLGLNLIRPHCLAVFECQRHLMELEHKKKTNKKTIPASIITITASLLPSLSYAFMCITTITF
jgi:hypothetical protein